MIESILESVKKQLGILPDYKHFDEEIIMGINSSFFILNQLGVGPETPFTIEDDEEVWSNFIPEGTTLELVKSYIPLRVRLLFDPPTNSYLVESINKQIQEFEFRLMVDAEKSLLPPADMGDIYVTGE